MGLSIEPDPKRDATRTFTVVTAVVVGFSVLWWNHETIVAELAGRFSPVLAQVTETTTGVSPQTNQSVKLVYSAIVTPETEISLSPQELTEAEHPPSPNWSDWPEQTDVQIYTVQAGDTLWGIAYQFGLDLDTLLWSNPDLEANPDLLLPGSDLVILPIVGVYHTVVEGDTLESIATQYGVAEIDLTNYPANRLLAPHQFTPGKKLVVPYGRKNPTPLAPAPDPDYVLAWPVNENVVRDYADDHPGLDLGGFYNAEVYAADVGIVFYSGRAQAGYGFTIAIDHGLNRQTLYSHLKSAAVQKGDQVERGQVIGSIGSTGDPVGPYLHFELREDGRRVNPLVYLNARSGL